MEPCWGKGGGETEAKALQKKIERERGHVSRILKGCTGQCEELVVRTSRYWGRRAYFHWGRSKGHWGVRLVPLGLWKGFF